VFRAIIHAIAVLFIVGGVAAYWRTGLSFVAALFPLLGIYWFLLRPVERRWALRRRFAKRPDKNIEIEWQIWPDRLVTSHKLGCSEVCWDGIMEVVQTSQGYLVYSSPGLFHWLSRHGFQSDDAYERLRELAKDRGIRTRHVA